LPTPFSPFGCSSSFVADAVFSIWVLLPFLLNLAVLLPFLLTRFCFVFWGFFLSLSSFSLFFVVFPFFLFLSGTHPRTKQGQASHARGDNCALSFLDRATQRGVERVK
jgi:hypothetical protein